jgi:hypothetical protein
MVTNARKEFIKLCVDDGILPSKFLSDPMNIMIGRYLDDTIAYKYWQRFMCIDNKYREWEHPYFINYDRNLEGICINNISSEIIEFFRDKKIDTILDKLQAKD